MRQLDDLAAAHRAERFRRVTVEVGPLSGVEPDLLRRAFSLLSPGTRADGAELVINSSPVRVHCSGCGVRSTVPLNRLTCASCGDWRTRVIAGDELFLRRVEMDTSGNEEPAHVH